MFAFPFSAVSEMARSNAEMQLSIGLAVSNSMLDTSSSLGRMTMQSGKTLMDQLTFVFNDAIQRKAGDPAEPFMPVHPAKFMDAMKGSTSNPDNISPEHERKISLAFEVDDLKKSSPRAGDAKEAVEHAESHHEHEADPRPSRLIEKLVASVASDTNILEK